MTAAPHPSLLVSLGVGALILWRIYSRLRRMVGHQKFSNIRPWITIVVFPMLLVLLLLSSFAHPINALVILLGAACGIALGLYGLRLTKFEQTADGLFYRPSAHMGIALSLLLLGRLVYRLFRIYPLEGQASIAMPTDFANSPLTLVIFSMLAGYYVTYAVGLLRWHRRIVRDSIILQT